MPVSSDAEMEDDKDVCFRGLSLGQCHQLFTLLTAQEVRDSMSTPDAEYLRANGVVFRAEGGAELESAVERLQDEVRICCWYFHRINIITIQ